MFTNSVYGSLDISVFEKFFQEKYRYYYYSDRTDIIAFGRSYYAGNSEEDNIKIDLFYHDEITDPFDTIEGIRIASLKDVVAMKVDVILRGGRKKDFWDLHELLDTFTIPEMLELHKQRYEYTHNRDQIIANLTNFSSADEDLDPICLKGKEWELIKLDFVEMINKLVIGH